MKCPSCGNKSLVKKVSAAGFRLKGGGWYETDFKTKAKKDSDVTSTESGGKNSDSNSSSAEVKKTKDDKSSSKDKSKSTKDASSAKRLRKGILTSYFAVERDNKRKVMQRHLCGEVKGIVKERSRGLWLGP